MVTFVSLYFSFSGMQNSLKNNSQNRQRGCVAESACARAHHCVREVRVGKRRVWLAENRERALVFSRALNLESFALLSQSFGN